MIIIGNIIALLAAILMVINGYIKSSQKCIILQVAEYTLHTARCIVLNAFSGAIINLLAIPRNILAYKKKLNLIIKIVIWLISIILSIVFNSNGIIGYLPLIPTTIYAFLIDKLTGIPFKIMSIISLLFWLVYDIAIQSYVTTIFDILAIITSIIAIYKIKNDKIKNDKIKNL